MLLRFAAIIFGIFFVVRPAAALEFSPAATDIAAYPGLDGVATFTIVNDSPSEADYVASIYGVDFDEEGDPIFGPLDSAYTGWFTLDSYNFSLESDASRELRLVATIPESAADDALVVALVVRELAQNTGVTISTGFSGLVFVTIGSPIAAADMTEFTARSRFAGGLPIDFSATFHNDGERTLQPQGLLVIRNMLSLVSDEISFNDVGNRVPAGQSRTFVATWSDTADAASLLGRLWSKVTDFRIGVFTAELTVTPYPGGPAMYDTTRVVVFPWQAGIILLGCGAVVFFAVVRRKNRA